MSDPRTAAEYANELLEVTDEWAPAGDIDPDKLASALAAAEERGRRSGVEERETLRLVLTDARYWFAARALPDRNISAALLARIDAALAPRDCAPVCNCEALLPGGHSPHCAVRAPRDSGKDNATAADPYDRFAKDDEP